MTTITATTILRSRNIVSQNVLSTLLLRYPRCIHSEFMTHRVFSKNSASSRAIPVEKLIKDVEQNPFIPLVWGKDKKGMQSSEECDNDVELFGGLQSNHVAWLKAKDKAVEAAKAFAAAGYHKQIVNRLLEPFAHITVLVSSTWWLNFLELRDHPAAEPHIQLLAKEIRKCLDDQSTIQDLKPGEWHLPFIYESEKSLSLDVQKKLSVARCASTSYKTVDGFEMSLERAVELHDRLIGSTPIHASPAEHVAQADRLVLQKDGSPFMVEWERSEQHGNFVGFRQYRHQLEG